jgi:hypothetical protein
LARPPSQPATGTAELPELELRSAQQRKHDPERERDDVEDQPEDHKMTSTTADNMPAIYPAGEAYASCALEARTTARVCRCPPYIPWPMATLRICG